jgi:4-amino-4-deoxy-L-arabinose transferase-like glycosyltransferase
MISALTGRRPTTVLVAGVLAIVSLALYASYLGSSPGDLNHLERSMAGEAQAIASTGRDLEGRLLPLYFHISDTLWFQPVPVYFTALLFKLWPAPETGVRWPTAIVGTIDVVLMYLVARKLLRQEPLAIVAACLLMMMPAHFIHSRLAMDYLYPVPFVLGWLLSLLGYLEQPAPRRLVAATTLLGIGCYTHSSALILMPMYLIVTCAAVWLEGSRPTRYFVAAAGFVAPLLLLVPWFLTHPGTYLDTVGRWAVHPAHVRYPLEGLKAAANWGSLTVRAGLYWEFLGPALLFFGRDATALGSMPGTGMFLAPVALLIPIGVYQIVTSLPPPIGRVLLLATACTPIAAALLDERYAIGHELALLPLVITIAAFGVDCLFSTRRTGWRLLAISLLVVTVVQFCFFDREYFRAYRADVIVHAQR